MEEKSNIDISNAFAEKPSVRKNTVYNVIRTFTAIIFPLITFPYTSRVLKTESIGKINFGQSIVGYFSLMATLGITTYAVRECSKVKADRKKLGEIASQILSINVCTTIISYILLFICLGFVKKFADYRLLILLQSLSILFATLGADWLNVAMEDFKYITIRGFVFQLIAIVSLFLFVHRPQDYYISAIISLLSSCGAQIINIIYRRRFCDVKISFDINWKRHFPPIMSLFVMILSQSIYSNLDITMLGLIHGDTSVGLYTTATKITNIVMQVIASITWVVMPQLSYYFSVSDYKEINKILKYVTSFTIVLGLPCIAGINILADDVILFIAGSEYLASANCLRILTVSMAFSFISNIFGNMVLLPANREKIFIIACIVAAIVNAFSNAIIIPLLGIDGAALTTTLSNIIIAIIVVKAIEKDISLGSKLELIRGPVVGTLLLCVVCWGGKILFPLPVFRVLFGIGVGAIVYLIALLVCRDKFTHDFLNSFVIKVKKKGY